MKGRVQKAENVKESSSNARLQQHGWGRSTRDPGWLICHASSTSATFPSAKWPVLILSVLSTWLLLTISSCNVGSTTQMQITRGSNSARPSLNKISQPPPAAEKCEMKFPSSDGWILSATSKRNGSLEQAELSPSVYYFWLHWVFTAMCRPSPVVVSRGHSLAAVRRLLFSLRWLLVTEHRVSGVWDAVVLAHRLRYSEARGSFLPAPRIKPVFPALAGRVPATGPPRKAQGPVF